MMRARHDEGRTRRACLEKWKSGKLEKRKSIKAEEQAGSAGVWWGVGGNTGLDWFVVELPHYS